MIVGTCWIDLQVPGVRSLKEKRRVIKSMKERLKGHFNISIAEVGALDKWQRAEIGFACVGNDSGRVDGLIATVLDRIRSDPRVFVIDIETEIL